MMTDKQRTNNRLIVIAGLIVLLLAWWVRLTYFNELREVFPDLLEEKKFCGLDGNVYDNAARGFLKGEWPGDLPFIYMILYPFYLSTIYTVFGLNLKIAVIFQILLEVVTCASVYGIGRLTFNKKVGLLASCLCAFYAPLIFHTPCFTQENLTVPLLSLAIFFLLKVQASSKSSYFVPAGIITGLAGLSRPTMFLLIPIALLWLWLAHRSLRRLIWQGLIYGGVVFLVTLPVTLHNYRTADHFSPTPVTGWEGLFTGNNPVAEGLDMTDYVLYNYIKLPGAEYIKSVIDAEEQTHTTYRDETLKFITTNPLGWLNLLGRKSYLLLGETDSNLISPYFVHNLQTTPLLRHFPIEWRSIFIGALLGIFLLKHKRRSWLVLSALVILIGITILFYAQLRFRLIFVPLVLIYTAALIVTAPRLSRPKLIFALVTLAMLYPFLPVLGWLVLLFIASLLWPHLRRRNWPVLRWPVLATWSYLVVAILLVQIIGFAMQAGQSQAIFRGPQIAGPVALGQTFVVPCDGFNRLNLTFGAFDAEEPQPVIFHLRSDLDNPADIYTVTLDTSSSKDRSRHDIIFPAQTNSAGQAYFFFFEAPLTTPDQAITLRGTYDQPFNRYKEGSAYIGQPGAWQRLQGDIAFRARCDVNPLVMINQAFQKLAVDTFGSPIFYWTLLITHSVLLIIALFKLQKLTNPPHLIG